MNIVGNRTLKSALEDKARRFPAKTFLLFEAPSTCPPSRSPWGCLPSAPS